MCYWFYINKYKKKAKNKNKKLTKSLWSAEFIVKKDVLWKELKLTLDHTKVSPNKYGLF